MNKKPNIVFFMTDEQRFDAVGYANAQVHTPNLDRLAAQSVRFDNAYTPNPSCIPARASIFTGRYPSQCGAPCYITPLAKGETTFMKLLQQGGYYTAVIGKQHFWTSEVERGYDYEDIVDDHMPPRVISKQVDPADFGLPQNHTVSDRVSSYRAFLADSGFTRGDQLYRQIDPCGVYAFFGQERYHVDAYIGDRGLRWLDEGRPTDRPWFLTLSFPGPHMPFDGIGLPDADLYDEQALSLPDTDAADLRAKPPHYQSILRPYGLGDGDTPGGLSPAQIRRMKRAYYANMSLIDRKIGAFLDRLRQLGLYDDTLILYTSDHGEYLGDFGVATKAQYLSEALIRVPMLLKPPMPYAGSVEPSLVSSVEIAATFLTAAGLPVPPNISPRSLTQFYGPVGERELWGELYAEARDIRSIRDGRYKLIYYAGRDYGELYDLATDPIEKRNRWNDPSLRPERDRLERRLLDRLISLGENARVPWNRGAPVI